MPTTVVKLVSAISTALTLAAPPDLFAQETGPGNFPARPIRLVVGSAPGGGIDFVGRLLGQRMTEVTGQAVVIDNKPGASTTIGAAIVAKAPPDGYTLFMASTSIVIAGALYRNVPYDTIKDFAPVTLVASGPLIIAVNPTVPASNLGELIAWAKARPGKLTFGSSGTGTSVHLAGELFRASAGIQYVHVPYKGGSGATADLISGRIDMVIASITEILGQVKTGKVRAIAVTGSQRSPLLPEVPTTAESGLPLDVAAWYGVLAPAGTPRDTVNKLHEIIVKSLADPEARARLIAQSANPTGEGPEIFGPYLRSELARWSRVIKEGGVRPD